MPSDPQRFSLPSGKYGPIRCKITVFDSMESIGQVVLLDNGMAHFVSDDGKLQILVRADALHVTALPTNRLSHRYDVSIYRGTEIRAFAGKPGDWDAVGTIGGEDFKPLSYQGQSLAYAHVDEPQEEEQA